MQVLTILWQRLVDPAGQTCPRCSATGQELTEAVARLRAALAPLGIEPRLDIRAITPAAFRDQPLESNRIWVAGQPLEAWLHGTTGASPCCTACGDADCRTLEVDGTRHETIPQTLVIRAALIAASQMLATDPPAPSCCCGGGGASSS